MKPIPYTFKRWYCRNIRARRQPAAMTHEAHHCICCGQDFEGNFCPRCGQPAAHEHVGTRYAVANILDIWGLGDPLIPRTLLQLFYRPGYLILDYLRGIRVGIYHPIKLVLIMGIFSTFLSWLFVSDSEPISAKLAKEPDDILKTFMLAGDWIDDHQTISLLAIHLLMTFFSWLIFHRTPRLGKSNLSQHFMAQTFIISQMLVIENVILCFAPEYMASLTIYDIPFALFLTLLLVDYVQVFGRPAWATLWRVILMYTLSLICIFTIIIVTYFVLYFTTHGLTANPQQ